MKNQELYLFGIDSNGESFPKEWGWEYCQKNRIPFIYISMKEESEYSHVKVDLNTLHNGLLFQDSRFISDSWQKFYEEYRNTSEMPDEKWSFVGTDMSYGVTIWSKDALSFAPAIHKYTMLLVKEFGKIDLLLAEYTNISNHKKSIMNMAPYNKIEYDKLTKQQLELRFKIWDQNFERKTDYDEGRIIPFE